jgi:hypothetical protein
MDLWLRDLARDPKETNMSRSLARLAALLTIVAAFSIGAVTPANAGTVPNRFHRTCNWYSCSGYTQVNGPYVAGIISNCVTYNWWGSVRYSYLKWGRC